MQGICESSNSGAEQSWRYDAEFLNEAISECLIADMRSASLSLPGLFSGIYDRSGDVSMSAERISRGASRYARAEFTWTEYASARHLGRIGVLAISPVYRAESAFDLLVFRKAGGRIDAPPGIVEVDLHKSMWFLAHEASGAGPVTADAFHHTAASFRVATTPFGEPGQANRAWRVLPHTRSVLHTPIPRTLRSMFMTKSKVVSSGEPLDPSFLPASDGIVEVALTWLLAFAATDGFQGATLNGAPLIASERLERENCLLPRGPVRLRGFCQPRGARSR
ncbi:hypothetical protein FE249_17995 (plasmid) [Acidiphilium multivorum]|uniref:hypothetical protein n=1 Tax=Acidiphilium multivorum TaxID=62140 RepID=UPI001F4C3CB8|nr:hypothetical protein [Acidiphilium multivorum]UNC16149.1 hypothetical protein FE249_17995 [Acidiphilium multivorum]